MAPVAAVQADPDLSDVVSGTESGDAAGTTGPKLEVAHAWSRNGAVEPTNAVSSHPHADMATNASQTNEKLGEVQLLRNSIQTDDRPISRNSQGSIGSERRSPSGRIILSPKRGSVTSTMAGRPSSGGKPVTGSLKPSHTNIQEVIAKVENQTLSQRMGGKSLLSLEHHSTEGSWQRKLHVAINHWSFKGTMAFIILMNAVYIGVETDQVREASHSSKAMPWYGFEVAFNVVFIIELALRTFVERTRFFLDGWNTFDFLLVTIGCLDTFVLAELESNQLRVITVMRMLRVARIFRIFRILRFFKELWLLILGVFDALKTLFWSFLLLALLCYICGIFLTRTLVGPQDKAQYFAMGPEGVAEYTERMKWFGSVARSMFTLFQVVTTDNWLEIISVASKKYVAMYVFFPVFMIFTTYSTMNVVVAVIVEKTLERAVNHRENQLKQAESEIEQASEKILDIFNAGDEDGNGFLTKDEFYAAISRPDVMRFLHEVGVRPGQADNLFDVLDYDESGRLDVQEFVQGVMLARGEARSKDLLAVHCELWRAERLMKKELAEIKEETEKSVDLLQSEMKSIKFYLPRLKAQAAELAGMT
eukprot:gnl/TRDRNA2_/TRDRNA2_85406_c0_seq1.p1 gnl/TRDRNA2_/TRDRNA2_85406_c0~~gnl/TRDRNA2_/TRDRNA2_85406_c0_seq1.p1  ORF type:complete len:607 (-),score=114.66 gnl/TRDRNA2_/TRDRNA2_85406_c0_seq1:114-1886(-)